MTSLTREEGTTYHLALPWDRPPLSLNQHLHWAKRNSLTQEVRETAGWLARAARIPPSQHCVVTLSWAPPLDWRDRDEDNLVGTLKPSCDGIVDSGIVPSDTPHWMTKNMPVILPGPVRGMWLTVEVR